MDPSSGPPLHTPPVDDLIDLLHHGPSLVLCLEPAGYGVTFVTANVERLLGYTPGEMAATFWTAVVHQEDRQPLREGLDRAVTGTPLRQECRMWERAGACRRLTLQIRGLPRDGVPALVVLYGDAHETCSATAGATAVAQGDRGRDVDDEAARLEAERASRAKSEFLSRMSHELRTPLNAVLGFAQVIAMDPLSAEQADSVRQILRAGGHLLDLINEALDIARIEAGRLSLNPEPLALADTVARAVDLMRPLAAAAAVRVIDHSAADNLHVIADRSRVMQVLLNLLGNAVKYNRPGGSVRISCQRRGDAVRLLVEDTGRGIASGDMARLFLPFERLGAEHGPIEGTGLGLAVAKGVTEAMAGSIGVESAPGHGATFWIELPRSAAPAPPPAAHPQPRRTGAAEVDTSGAQGTLLYVEDNAPNVRLMERILSRRPGIHLVTAGSGREALRAVRARRPDFVLLDLHLPDLSGDDVLRALAGDPATRRIPVTVLSADASAEQQARMAAAGAVAYLTKPLDVTALLGLLDDRLAPATTRGEPSRR